VKYIIFFILVFGGWSLLIAQDNSSSSEPSASVLAQSLLEKKIEYNKRTNGEGDGYRVKIHFSSDRTKAREIQTKFEAKFPEVPSYEEYQQPNFVINVGDFKTKLEAHQMLKKIKDDFPYSFIVKSKIKPTDLQK
jgi:hypothetical protein